MKAGPKPISAGKRFRFRVEAGAGRALAWLVPKFPRRVVQRVGRALGALAYYVAPELRRISRANLDTAFGDTKSPAEKQRIARASLQNAGATLLTLFWAPRLTREVLDPIADLDRESVQRVREIQARGNGIIFLAMHYGDWELIGLATGFYGIQLTVVQEALKNTALEELIGRLRAQSGHAIVPSRFAAMSLLKTLKRGGSIALLNDLNATRKRGGVWLDFFGLPVFNNTAIAALALHTGAAIVPGVAHPLADGRVRIVYGPEIAYTPTDDATAINQKCLRFCEEVIRAAPEHWMWSYKRFTPRATAEQGRYPAYSRFWPDLVQP